MDKAGTSILHSYMYIPMNNIILVTWIIEGRGPENRGLTPFSILFDLPTKGKYTVTSRLSIPERDSTVVILG